MRKGQSAFAVLGFNASETQASIDAALTFGILWLEAWRHSLAGKFLVEGLHLFVPHGCSALVRERIANLNRTAAKWSLFELDERHDALAEIDCTDCGNVATRLVHATNETAALERFAESIASIQNLLPNCKVAVLSAADLAFRWRGLEFARARPHGRPSGNLPQQAGNRLWCGRGRGRSRSAQFPILRAIANSIRDTRHPYGPRQHPLFRLRPERWLESLVVADVSVIDERLEPRSLYSQVPAFTASDRDARYFDHHPRRPARGRGTQSRRRYSPAGRRVYIVAVLASAAVEPPIFIGFSLLADPDQLKVSALPSS